MGETKVTFQRKVERWAASLEVVRCVTSLGHMLQHEQEGPMPGNPSLVVKRKQAYHLTVG